jgi:acetolactate synthase-1/2/3 large subunit
MNDRVTVADALLQDLERIGVDAVFGIISIHNIPFYDALQRHGGFRVVTARHEGAVVNMADAYSRVSENLVLRSPVPERVREMRQAPSSNRGMAGRHCCTSRGTLPRTSSGRDAVTFTIAKISSGCCRASAKKRIASRRPEQAPDVFRRAILEAMQPPPGPVSVEVPIDFQAS